MRRLIFLVSLPFMTLAAYADPASSFERRSRTEAAVDGYFIGRTADIAACEQRCTADTRCKMYEFYAPRRQCSFYEATAAGRRAPQSTIGLRGPEPQTKPPSGATVAKSPPRDDTLALEISYAERIGVPRGSALDVTIRDRSGRTVSVFRGQTRTPGPPYQLDVAVKELKELQFPIQIEAQLTSRNGHRFSQVTDVNGPVGAEPLKIVVQRR